MPTVINNPGTGESSGNNLVLSIILVVVVIAGIALFFVYGLPMLKGGAPADNTIEVDLKLPEGENQQPAQ